MIEQLAEAYVLLYDKSRIPQTQGSIEAVGGGSGRAEKAWTIVASHTPRPWLRCMSFSSGMTIKSSNISNEPLTFAITQVKPPAVTHTWSKHKNSGYGSGSGSQFSGGSLIWPHSRKMLHHHLCFWNHIYCKRVSSVRLITSSDIFLMLMKWKGQINKPK